MLLWTLWNLFLAASPVVLAVAITRRLDDPVRSRRQVAGTATLLVAWLLLLPNAPYLLTEFRHFLFDAPFRALTARASSDPGALRLSAMWGALFAGYGAAGLLAYVLAVRPLERRLPVRGVRLIACRAALAAVVALGVWLGLSPRFNSWDAVFHPVEVLSSALWAVTHAATLLSILAFAAALFVLHTAFDLALDGVRRRSIA